MWVQTLRCIPWFPSPATPASFPGGEAGVGGGGVFRVGCSCCFRVAGSWIVSVSVCIIIEFVVYLINIGLKRCCCLFFFLFFFFWFCGCCHTATRPPPGWRKCRPPSAAPARSSCGSPWWPPAHCCHPSSLVSSFCVFRNPP